MCRSRPRRLVLTNHLRRILRLAVLSGGVAGGLSGPQTPLPAAERDLIPQKLMGTATPNRIGSTLPEATPDVTAKEDNTVDWVARQQESASQAKKAAWGHWGDNPADYHSWTNHSNRLIPVYSFGCDLQAFSGEHSLYRDAAKIETLYGRADESTLNPEAPYFDQTDLAKLQRQLVTAGKRRVILVVFDGMDWISTWLAATYNTGAVRYTEGRGTGLIFQDYDRVQTDFGWMVTSPLDAGSEVDVDAQLRLDHDASDRGGYDWRRGGDRPWIQAADVPYLINRSFERPHAVTDSSSSATSMTAGIKTFNGAVNVDGEGRPTTTIAHELQQQGWAVGVVTSVPISHATPAAAYARNVSRDDYQDLSRDLLGLPSVSHRQEPLPGMDVVLGAGWGIVRKDDKGQGQNFVPGNRYLAQDDLEAAAKHSAHPYTVATRVPGRHGSEILAAATQDAIANKQRLLAFFGADDGHLPFRTANGDYQPVKDVRKELDVYTADDVVENPTLAEMTTAALDVLDSRSDKFWLMLECGDVDWANHANNVDSSIGAVLSGDLAVRQMFDWIEQNGGWEDTAVIITSDHGHYFNPLDLEQFFQAEP